MKEYHFSVQGNPVAWARVSPNYTNRTMYNTQKGLVLVWGVYLRNQMDERERLQGAIGLSITYYMPIPKSKSKLLKENDFHIIKPDTDNLTKFICDIARDIVYDDDCQVALNFATKRYSSEPRVDFTFFELSNDRNYSLYQEKKA